MKTPSWLHGLARKWTDTRRRTARRTPSRLQVEQLEDRLTPSVNAIWTNADGTGIWSDGLNWTGGTGTNGVPGTTQIAEFASGAPSSIIDAGFSQAQVDGILIDSGYTNTISDNLSTLAIGTSGLSQAGGTFFGGALTTINDAGDWSVTSGSFTPGSSTVNLDGTSQQIFGNNTFYNLSKTTSSADTLTFAAASTTTILNALTLTGSTTGNLSLVSSTTGTPWLLNLNNGVTESITYVDVSDSNANGGQPITPTHSINSGDNTNWNFQTATQYVFSTIGTQTAGNLFSVTVSAEDDNYNTDASYNGTADLTSNATLSGSPVGITFTNGVASTGVTITSAQSGTTLTASATDASGLSGTSNSFTVNPGAPYQLIITTQPPGSVDEGESFGLVVTEEDFYGNLVTTDNSGVVQLNLLPSGSFSPGSTTSLTVTGGVADFTTSGGLLAIDTAGTYQIQATEGGLVTDTSDDVVVNVPPPSRPINKDTTTGTTISYITAVPGEYVGITAFSTDNGGPPISYSITSQPSGHYFTILPNSGKVILSLLGANITPGVYPITVQASNGSSTASRTFYVTANLGADVVVTTNLDETNPADHTISLREAIENAEQYPQVHSTITFAPWVTGTIYLTQGSLYINHVHLTIQGPGANVLTINGDGTNGSIFDIEQARATISGLTITGGSSNSGGGIYNYQASLTLNNDVIVGNNATSGGGIYSYEAGLNITNSTIAYNTATDFAGGIYSSRAGLHVTSSTISNNSATFSAGIGVTNGSAYLSSDTISNNSATDGAGGVGIGSSGNLTIFNTILDGNSAPIGGDLFNNGSSGNITSSGGNLYGADGTVGFTWNTSGLYLDVADPNDNPGLGALQYNGGTTPTLAVLPGSPAIGVGLSSGANDAMPPPTDQRGFSRTGAGGEIDSGAFQNQSQLFTQVAPVNSVPGPGGIYGVAGQSTSFNLGSFTYSGGQTSWTVDVNWGDGSADTIFTVTHQGALPQQSHIYATVGQYTLTVTVYDKDNNFTQASGDLTVGGVLTVNTFNDTDAANPNISPVDSNGDISLRSALEFTGNGLHYFAPFTVDFAPWITGTLNVGFLPTLENGNVFTLQGPGANVLTIRGQYGPLLQVVDSNDVSINGLTFTNGHAGGNGGGLFILESNVTLNNDLITGNSAAGSGGGIYSQISQLTLNNDTISNNTAALDGGGIASIASSSNASVHATNVTITGNQAAIGGGVYNGSSSFYLNSLTITGNSASGSGGGIYNGKSNYSSNYGNIYQIFNTILDGNQADTGGDLYNAGSAGNITSSGGNLYGQGGTVGFTWNTGTFADISDPNNNPGLGALQNNGGTTPTLAELPGSPALTAGLGTGANGATPPNTDQRGFSRFTLLPTPAAAPAVSTASGGTLTVLTPPTAPYYVAVTYVTATGETLSSDYTRVVMPAGQQTLIVDAPPSIPDAIGYDVYIGAYNNSSLTRQNLSPIPFGTNWTQSTPLISGSSLPTTNTARVLDIGAFENQSQLFTLVPPASPQNVTAGVSTPINLGSFSYTGSSQVFMVDVNWGDGTPDLTFTTTLTGALPAKNHTYTVAGTHHLTITINDADNNFVQTPQPSTDSVVVSPAAPFSITITAGNPQSAQVGAAFVTNLAVKVADQFGNPISGLIVTFTAPSGQVPSGTFAGGINTATTTAGGVATAHVFTANFLAGSYTVAATTTGLGSSANFSLTNTSPLGSTPNAIFVQNIYGQLLNRVADSGASFFLNELNASNPGGPPTVAATTMVIEQVQSSKEYLQDVVSALYQHYLGRAVDSGGLSFWTGKLQTGTTFEQVAEGLVISPEYTTSHSTNSAYVTGLYQQVLGRTPSGSELTFWVNQLNQGSSRLQVATSFLTSMEYRTDLLNGGTWTPYNPLTNWGGYYPQFLRRQADTPGLNFWLGQFSAGLTDQVILASIFGSAEGYAKSS